MSGSVARRLAGLLRRGRSAAPTLAELQRATPGLHRLFADDADALATLAAVLFTRGHVEPAMQCLERARANGYPAERATVLLARHYIGCRQHPRALELLRPLLERGNPSVHAWEVAGAAHFYLKNIPEAYVHYREAVRLQPTNAEIRGSFAGVLTHYGRFEEAIVEAKRALRFDPRSAVAMKNLSIACGALARLREEEEVLRLARIFHPQDAELELQLGFVRLRAGDYQSGWPLYEARLRTPDDLPRVRPSTALRPRWDGGPFPGKTLLIFGEQGYGDNIMVARFFPEVKAKGGTVVLEVQPALAGLLGRLPGPDKVITLDGGREPGLHYDLWIASMSLPFVLGVDPRRRAAPPRYLEPAAESVAYWRERTARARGRRIGIAWSGNPLHKNDFSRSIPLELIVPLFALPGTTFFSLQLNAGWSAELPKPPPLVDFTDELLTFDDTAALAECMDLVITVDTSVAHVAGGLGKPTWILVPHLAEWRWGLAGEHTPWYASATVLRQPNPGDWRGLLAQVRERLS